MAWENIEWRVDSEAYAQDDGGHRCRWVAYIDARHAAQTLDEWAGPGNWADSYSPGPDIHTMWCTIAVRDPVSGEWVAKTDVGVHVQTDKPAMANMERKALVSDAFKRACVKWGVARNVYAMPTVYAVCKVNRAGKATRHPDTAAGILKSLRQHGVEVEHTMVAESEPDSPVADVSPPAEPAPAPVASEGMVLVTDAKPRLLEACGGNKAKAGELWDGAGWSGLHGSDEVEESELAEICELAKDLGEEA